MKLPRRKFLNLAAGAVALPAFPRFARGQAYPSRPITMIVPYPGGAPMDVIGRILAERMRTSLGQPVIIENVSGADGSIGTGRAARARPDGYTIALGAKGTHVMNGAFYSLLFDPFNDFTGVAPLVTFPFILFARKTFVAKDLRDLMVCLKTNPNKASIAITNNGTRLLAMFFSKRNRHANYSRALSWIACSSAGLGGGSGRSPVGDPRSIITDASRQHKISSDHFPSPTKCKSF
jgi:tripartite-type tricarboxylate transporter receptor subunit TctC